MPKGTEKERKKSMQEAKAESGKEPSQWTPEGTMKMLTFSQPPP